MKKNMGNDKRLKQRVFAYDEMDYLITKHFKSIDSDGKTVAMLTIKELDIDKDYVIAKGLIVTEKGIEFTGKMNIAMWLPEERCSGQDIPLEKHHYVFYDKIVRAKDNEARNYAIEIAYQKLYKK